MDASQSSKGSGTGTARGSSSQNGLSGGRKKPGDGQGEVTSPVKKTSRARKMTAPKEQKARSSTAAADAVAGIPHARVTGQKRKQTKLVYKPKAVGAEAPQEKSIGNLALVVSSNSVIEEKETVIDDNNKKQRKEPSRSADPAEAAVQPRPTQ